MSYQVAGRTDIGCKRSNNEDAFGISRIPQGLLAIVADGMGGHHGGEVASELTVNCFLSEVPRLLEAGDAPQYAMTGAGNLAHCAIRQRSRQAYDLDKMGTTLVAVFLRDHDLHVIHAGDSRCYLHNGRELQQVTRDDSMVQQMMDNGGFTEADMANSPFRNVLTNSLSAAQELVGFSYQRFPVEQGYRILLCSDGLTNTLGVSEIDDMIGAQYQSPEHCVDQLIQRSLDLGAADNVTVIVIEAGEKS